MIVAKFGGAVLNGAEGVQRVRRELAALPTPVLVVVSAFARVTNRLERLASASLTDSAHGTELLEDLVQFHHGIGRDALSATAYDRWCADVEPLVSRLREVVQGLGIVRELSPRTLDLVVHFGERFSSSIVAAALNDGASESAT